ncbi:MAG: glycosyltransferase family 2 protein [Proteobacteria bacterium]|nr:glycosyltransferase family 2 protein [Sideroxydans sp.]MBU4046241.1 glycosyltransferase family 2 protein [Gammaproteobacteria bacterium]MBU4154388.1 glycosyltransferase family 2 protein [Pseudomonadota bacterium]
MTSFSLFVLCHDRADFARQTLHSILAQSDQDFELIVSDNSSNDEVGQMMRADFPQVEYRRRQPMLFHIAHFNRCIEEARGDLFCLFHDDDLMHPEFVKHMKAAMDADPRLVACGSNALLETMGRIEPRSSFRAIGKLEYLGSARDLARRYFARAQSGFAPFPGYVYRRSAAGALRLDVDGGKYTDVAWLLRLAMKGPIAWLNEPLLTYRIHGGNDGKVESPRDRLRFMAFLKRYPEQFGKALLADYRYSFIYKPLVKNAAATPARRAVARRFLSRHSWSRYIDPVLYRSLVKRFFIKWRVER